MVPRILETNSFSVSTATFMYLDIVVVDEAFPLSMYIDILSSIVTLHAAGTQGAEPRPLPLRVAKAGRKIKTRSVVCSPLLPTWIGERYSQTISYLGHAALLRQCELPL